MAKRPTIVLVDISRSTEDKHFETEMYLHIYEKQKAAGKLHSNWVPKSEIESIETTVVNDGLAESKVEIEVVEEVEETTEAPIEEDLNESDADDVQDEEDDFELWTLEELQNECQKRGIKFTKKNKEKSLINKLRG